MLVEDLIQSHVERMRSTARQVLGRQPHRRLLRVSPSFAHRHRPQCSPTGSVAPIVNVELANGITMEPNPKDIEWLLKDL